MDSCFRISAESFRKSAELRLCQKLVLIDDGRHGQFAGGIAPFDAHDAALAAHAYAFGQSNLRRQGQSEIDGGAGLDRGIDVEADSARAHVASLRRVLLFGFSVTDAYRQAKREAPRGPLVIVLVALRFGHLVAPKKQGFKILKFLRFKERARL